MLAVIQAIKLSLCIMQGIFVSLIPALIEFGQKKSNSKMKFVTNLVLFVLIACQCESSYLKSNSVVSETEATTFQAEDFVSTAQSTTTEVTTLTTTEASENSESNGIESESIKSDETEPIDMQNGNKFRLIMTVHKEWNNDLLDSSSKAFNELAKSFGSEIVDFIDNFQEATKPNMTSFKMVSVQPSPDSNEKILVTSIISSQDEINGRGLEISLTNKIMIYGVIYDIEVSFDGFLLERITEKNFENLNKKVSDYSGA